MDAPTARSVQIFPKVHQPQPGPDKLTGWFPGSLRCRRPSWSAAGPRSRPPSTPRPRSTDGARAPTGSCRCTPASPPRPGPTPRPAARPSASASTPPRGPGFALLAQLPDPATGAAVLSGLEPLWGLRLAPASAPTSPRSPPDWPHYLGTNGHDWRALVLAGMPATIQPRLVHFPHRGRRAVEALGLVRAGEGIVRQVADLSRRP